MNDDEWEKSNAELEEGWVPDDLVMRANRLLSDRATLTPTQTRTRQHHTRAAPMAEPMPYYTPICAVGVSVPHRLALIECAECDWFTVSERGTDDHPSSGRDRWEDHYATEHTGRADG